MRHVHVWRELLPPGNYDRTTFIVCDKCDDERRPDATRYLNREATAEFRRQVKHGIKPRMVRGGLVGYKWPKK